MKTAPTLSTASWPKMKLGFIISILRPRPNESRQWKHCVSPSPRKFKVCKSAERSWRRFFGMSQVTFWVSAKRDVQSTANITLPFGRTQSDPRPKNKEETFRTRGVRLLQDKLTSASIGNKWRWRKQSAADLNFYRIRHIRRISRHQISIFFLTYRRLVVVSRKQRRNEDAVMDALEGFPQSVDRDRDRLFALAKGSDKYIERHRKLSLKIMSKTDFVMIFTFYTNVSKEGCFK